MSFQYIHTSAKRGLEPGKSGFCCVARSRDLPPDLAQELEQQSRYEHLASGSNPCIMRHRIATLRSGAYHILTRIQDSGTDYSKRNNHLAHHLAFQQSEIAGLPNPASILLNWSGWRRDWDEPPRVLSDDDAFHLHDVDTRWHYGAEERALPVATEKGRPLQRVFELDPGEERWLCEHFRRTLNYFRVSDQWSYSFTNFLLPTDQPDDYTWSGVWRGHTLPFEIDLRPRPLPGESTSTPDSEPSSLSSEAAPPLENAGSKAKIAAPVVEIPEAYDRRKRRRPKRKFGPREMARSINLSLAAAAAIAGAVLTLWLYRNHEGVDTLLDERRGAVARSYEDFTKKDREAWERYAANEYPAADLEEATAVAIRLAGVGEDLPLRICRFLQILNSEESIIWPYSLNVPSELVSSAGDGYRLNLSPVTRPRIASLILAPERLYQLAGEIAPAEANPAELFASLEGGTYSLADLERSLQAFLAKAGPAILPNDQASLAAIERFLAEKDAVLNDPRFTSMLELRRAFELPDSASYLAFDADGRLADDATLSYSQHLVALFSDYVLSNFSDFENASDFKAAFNAIGAQSFENPSDAVLAIYNAIILANPKPPEAIQKWQVIRQSWSEAFIRDDLMEQTLVSYTMEALETAKLSLVQLQEQFSVDELADYFRLQRLANDLEAFAEKAATLSNPKEWVVFDQQPDNF